MTDSTPIEDKKPWYKNLFLWYFIIGAVTLTLIRPLLRREPPPPPVQGRLAAFELVDQDGKPFTLNDLEGNTWVANFIDTTCTSTCSQLTEGMVLLQDRYAAYGIDGVRLLSITIDPEHDTPEILRAYAQTHGADLERWTLLTGDPAAVRALLLDGFELPGVGLEIPHPGQFVILDPTGGIRGVYGSDLEGLDEVYHRARHVLREARER
jgi:protein SCO1/2